MAVEDEYLDVLQNIEFAIVSTYRDLPEIVDAHVIRALETVIDRYRAEQRGHAPPEPSVSGVEGALYEAIRAMCEWRLGRAGPPSEADSEEPGPRPLKLDEILLCLRKILKSVGRWNRSGGQTGYLEFIVQYVR